MRLTILFIFFLIITKISSAQLYIQAGAQVYITGTEQLTLHNMSLINNGTFITGNSLVSFTGNASASIGGSEQTQFYDLHINKENQSSVSMQNSYGVNRRVYFTAGFLNLNGNDLELGANGRLIGEHNMGRITGNGGGAVIFDTTLNAPAHANPGGLGVYISSSQNLGHVAIYRRHHWDLAGPGLSNSIRRQYTISAANNSNLDATLQFRYFEGELNNLQEEGLAFYERVDGIQWNGIGFNNRNTVLNYVEKSGIQSLHEYTLSGIGAALPVSFSHLETKCQDNAVLIQWKTAHEQNSQRFDIQKSSDGVSWSVVGIVPAAGNSTETMSYSYTDPNNENNYYRVAEYDVDGSTSYSKIIRALCASPGEMKLWPNPSGGPLHIMINAGQSSKITLKIYDSKGALITQQHNMLLKGSNQLALDISSAAAGMYTVMAEWNNGQSSQTLRVIKK